MEFDVLRPWAFLFLIPALLFCFFRLKSVQAWLGIVDAHLLEPLLVRTYLRFKERLGALFLIACVFSLLGALAGISLKGSSGSLYHPKIPAVVVLDMSLSMKVKDIPPNRFSRAIFKVYDLLAELKGVPVALIVFTDEPYQLIPVTADKEVIETVLPLLSFNLMPSQGSRTDRAIEDALRTIKETGAGFGDIFLITDGADDVWEIQDKTETLIRTAAQNGSRLFILGVGTLQGGQLFEKEDIPALDALGNPIIHRLKEGYLKRLAQIGGGEYARVQTDNSDIAALIKVRENILIAGEKSALTDQSLHDTGYWFLILPLIGFSFLFQKGRLLLWFLIVSIAIPAQADILDHFLSPAGQAMWYLEQGKQDSAIETARQSDHFTALYNVGTRLIFLQNYPQAIELLEKAVQKKPDNENAQINLEIARRLNENPSPDEAPNAGENDETQNQDQSGAGGGQAEGENGLNQNGNNSSQDNESNEENSDESGTGEGVLKAQDRDQGNEESNQNDSDSDNGEAEKQPPQQGNERESPASPDNSEGREEEPQNGEQTPDESGGDEGENSDTNAGNGEQEPENPDKEQKLIPVHEDPLTLLRHKILFLHHEKRYNEEKQIGAQW